MPAPRRTRKSNALGLSSTQPAPKNNKYNYLESSHSSDAAQNIIDFHILLP